MPDAAPPSAPAPSPHGSVAGPPYLPSVSQQTLHSGMSLPPPMLLPHAHHWRSVHQTLVGPDHRLVDGLTGGARAGSRPDGAHWPPNGLSLPSPAPTRVGRQLHGAMRQLCPAVRCPRAPLVVVRAVAHSRREAERESRGGEGADAWTTPTVVCLHPGEGPHSSSRGEHCSLGLGPTSVPFWKP